MVGYGSLLRAPSLLVNTKAMKLEIVTEFGVLLQWEDCAYALIPDEGWTRHKTNPAANPERCKRVLSGKVLIAHPLVWNQEQGYAESAELILGTFAAWRSNSGTRVRLYLDNDSDWVRNRNMQFGPRVFQALLTSIGH